MGMRSAGVRGVGMRGCGCEGVWACECEGVCGYVCGVRGWVDVWDWCMSCMFCYLG